MAATQIGTSFDAQSRGVDKSYDAAKQNASNDALARGMSRSSYVSDRLSGLDSDRSEALANVEADKQAANTRPATADHRHLQYKSGEQAAAGQV